MEWDRRRKAPTFGGGKSADFQISRPRFTIRQLRFGLAFGAVLENSPVRLRPKTPAETGGFASVLILRCSLRYRFLESFDAMPAVACELADGQLAAFQSRERIGFKGHGVCDRIAKPKPITNSHMHWPSFFIYSVSTFHSSVEVLNGRAF